MRNPILINNCEKCPFVEIHCNDQITSLINDTTFFGKPYFDINDKTYSNISTFGIDGSTTRYNLVIYVL